MFFMRMRPILTNVSSYGDNEQLLGKWFKRTGKRDEIFLASKFGIFMENGKHEKARVITTGEYCKKACDASLKRLGIESIDLCTFFDRKI